jgi:predicted 3-demethylubiquinone-9 3-methyltransferase (glyoxalase superfamily)
MQKLTPCLWFDIEAEEAVDFYVSIFRNSKKGGVTHFGEDGPRPKELVMTVSFTLDGMEFLALNGGPEFSFSPAISFIVNCETQKEIDTLWEKLSAGGSPGQCGWLTDKYGVSWQIVPTVLPTFMLSKDAKKSERVMKALMQMTKLDIKQLTQAFEKSD